MGKRYEYRKNYFRDVLVSELMKDIDISTKDFKEKVYGVFDYILLNYIDYEEDLDYLEFKITKNKDYFKVKGLNSISAFWLSGFFPKDIQLILRNDTFRIDNIRYKYDRKKNILKKYKNKKNG